MNISSVIKPVALAAICGLVISTIYFHSRENINQSRFEYETRQLKEVAGRDDVEIRVSSNQGYGLWKNSSLFGHIYGIETDRGYNGKITAWLAVDRSGKILGVRIRDHRETPGLGDKIDRGRSGWIENFKHKSLRSTPKEAWRIVKDGGQFDQFTGATITPRAVVNMVHEKLVLLQGNDLQSDTINQ